MQNNNTKKAVSFKCEALNQETFLKEQDKLLFFK